MDKTEFVEAYPALIKNALALGQKARREGILALEGEIDPVKIKERDILHYGLSMMADGTDGELIKKILGNIIAREKDEYARIYKIIQMEAVAGIQNGMNTRMLYYILNSYTDIPFKDDGIYAEIAKNQ